MRSTVAKSIAERLNELDYGGNATYRFQRGDSANWSPEAAADLNCYVIPSRSRWEVLSRRPTIEEWKKWPSVHLIFCKMLEAGTQDELDIHNDAIESIMDVIAANKFVDDLSARTYTYFPRGIAEEELPEDWQITSQETTDDTQYAGLLIRVYTIQLEETEGSL